MVLSIQQMHKMCANFSISFMNWSKKIDFIKNNDGGCVHRKLSEIALAYLSGMVLAYLILFVDSILLIGNDIVFLNTVKDYLKNIFYKILSRSSLHIRH
jgi:hypothetical protein